MQLLPRDHDARFFDKSAKNLERLGLQLNPNTCLRNSPESVSSSKTPKRITRRERLRSSCGDCEVVVIFVVHWA
jgi:hypothetical protein